MLQDSYNLKYNCCSAVESLQLTIIMFFLLQVVNIIMSSNEINATFDDFDSEVEFSDFFSSVISQPSF